MNLLVLNAVKKVKNPKIEKKNNRKYISKLVDNYDKNNLDLKEELLIFRYYLALEKYDIEMISKKEYKVIEKIYNKFIISDDPILVIEAHNFLYNLINKVVILACEDLYLIDDDFEVVKENWIKEKFNQCIKVKHIDIFNLIDELSDDFESNVLKSKLKINKK